MPKSDIDSKTLIKLIENGALEDVKNIDISSEEEESINLEKVYCWYLESEKLIRILANILPSNMSQPINQLRYAGHHILKSECNTTKNNADLIEAFKHCKRAYYDSIDLYVYHISDVFRSKAALVNLSNHKDNILKHIAHIQKLRLDCEERITYYKEVSKTLSEGLSLIDDVNQELINNKITDEILKEKTHLIQVIKKCKNNNKILLDANKTKIDTFNNKVSISLGVLSLILVAVTSTSILFQGYFTEKFVVPESKRSLIIEKLPTLTQMEFMSPLKTTQKNKIEQKIEPLTKNKKVNQEKTSVTQDINKEIN